MAGGDLLFLSHGYLGDVGSQTSFARIARPLTARTSARMSEPPANPRLPR